jgi:signal transduction histidine kinase
MKFRLQDISIRSKLVLMQVFTSVVVIGIVFGVFIFTDIRSYKQRKVNSVLSLTQVIGTNTVSTIRFQDQDAARDILQELQNVSPEIVNAAILDNDGKIFAAYSRNPSTHFSSPPDMHGEKAIFEGRSLMVLNNIVDGNATIGKVFLEVDLSELQQTKRFKYELSVLLLAMALIVSFLIAVVVQRYIARRLLKLVKKMKLVGMTGNYDIPLSDDGSDEISVLNDAFHKLMQQIKENLQRKDEFIGIASHELKTPLTSIKGYLDLLYMMESQEPKKQFAGKALENVNKLEKLVKDLLDVSKIQSGQLELNISAFDINALLKETIASVQMIYPSHHIVYSDNCHGDEVYADRQRIEQVLLNLISNAIKYSPEECKILIETRKHDNWCVIKIRDYGMGIPEEERKTIFERFYRSKNISVHISGFGLGLYICKDIIRRHKGHIWVEPQEKGSAFYFSLPLKIIDTTKNETLTFSEMENLKF